ncbi:g5744 [Coccomyxa elongata]
MESLRAATDRVVICLEKAEADLKAVAHRLEDEFQDVYGGCGANPSSVLQRLRKLERELPHVRNECWDVLTAKQELLERANCQLSATRELLEQLESKAGITFASAYAGGDPFEGFRDAMAGYQASMASLQSEEH